MDNANAVNVSLTAKDLISPTIGDLKAKIDQLGASARFSISAKDLAGVDMSRLTAGMALFQSQSSVVNSGLSTMGVLMANLATGAVMGGLQLATSLMGQFKDKVGEVAQLQTQAIASASDIATNLGVTQAKASSIYDKVQDKIAASAASLPGTTSDYNVIFNAVAGQIALQFRGHDDLFQKIALDITQRTGVLAAIRHANMGFSGDIVNRLIAGTTGWGEAQTTELFQKNPQLVQAMRGLAKQYGINLDNWKNLTTQTRLALLQNAMHLATPDSLIKQFDNTLEGSWQGLMTSWFDPRAGIFGFMRKIPSMNGRSVLDALGGLMQSLTDLNTQCERIGKRLGFDPMAGVIALVDWVASLTNAVNLSLTKPETPKSHKEWWSVLADWTVTAIDAVGSGLYSLMYGIDWMAVGAKTWDILVDLVKWLGKTLYKLNWSKLMDGIIGLFEAPVLLIMGFILKSFNNFQPITTVLNAATSWIDSIMDGLVGWFKDIWNKVQGAWNNTVGGISNTAQNFGSTVQGAWNSATGWVQQQVGNLTGNPTATQPTNNGTTLAPQALPIPQTGQTNTSQVQNNNVTVHAGNITDHESLANTVMDKLNSAFKTYQRGVLGQ